MRYVVAIIFSLLLLGLAPKVYARECTDTPSSDLNTEQLINFWNEVRDACNGKISENQGKQQTLKQVITTLNSKINLAQAQINQTQTQIAQLEKDIQVISGVLETVNSSMDQLSIIYIARVRESYKRMRTNQLDLLFSANSLNQFLENMKYLNTAKARDQLILVELERSRVDYNQKKTAKVTKQEEVQKLKDKLLAQKKDLSSQQAEKTKILVLTQNDEKQFQTLLNKAKAEIDAIKRFTASASPLANQTHCDDWGCYYSQRDSQWFYNTIGGSSEILGRVGCLITSTAMVASHYKKDIKPSDIAGSTNPFWPDTAYMLKGSWTVNGVTVERTETTQAKIDEELNAGNPVIVGLYNGPAHFIVIKGKNDQGYIMNDPYLENGFNRPFTEKYKTSDITQVNIVRVR